MDDVELALLQLSTLDQLGQQVRELTASMLLASDTRQAVIEALSNSNLASLPGWKGSPTAAASVSSGDSERTALTVMKRCERIGARLVFRGSDSYPSSLLDLEHPPLVLYVRGADDALEDGAGWIAVVGTRNATELGLRFAKRSAAELASAGLTVVSGLALGTDAAVHAGVLEAGGRTVAVLASGVDDITPRTNADLGRRLLGTGALVSEQPPGTRVGPWSFPDRNRIIAALAQHVVILEAGLGSGTTITAEAALELNRQLWVMPGRPGDQATAGCLHLLEHEQARLFTGSSAVLAAYPGLTASTAPAGLGAELVELAHLIASHLPCRLDELPGLMGITDRIPVLLGGLNLLKLHRIVHEDGSGQLSLVGALPPRQVVR